MFADTSRPTALSSKIDSVRTGPKSLTPGEQRVSELAACGLTNRQIAKELFVTVKAIEWHLSNTYSKLGISGRKELNEALGLPPRGGG